MFQGSLLVIILFRAIIAWFASNFISDLSYYCHLQEYSNVCLLPSRKIPLTIAILFAIFSFVLIIAGQAGQHVQTLGTFHLGKNLEISVGAKVDFLIGKKLFHLVVNPGKLRCPTMDLELIQTMRNV